MNEEEFISAKLFLDDFSGDISPIRGSAFLSTVDWRGIFSGKQPAQNNACQTGGYAAIGSAVEAAYNIKHQTRISLSAQSLVDCLGCNQFADFVNDYGVLREYSLYESSAYPWTGNMGSCQKNFPGNKYKPLEWEVSYFGRESISPQMAVSVLKRGPYLFRQAFVFPRHYTGGIYTPTEQPRQCGSFYYTSLVVGYGIDNQTNTDYWIVKAPFGETWGEQGFMKVKRDDASFNYGITCAYSLPMFD